jgi:lipoprotein-anchoring transpeptidase ErfK/SrfK
VTLALAAPLGGCGADSPTPSPAGPEPSTRAEERHAAPNSSGERAGDRRLIPSQGFAIAQVEPGAQIEVFDTPRGERLGVVPARTEFGSPTTFSVINQRGGWLQVTTPLAKDNQPRWIEAGSGLALQTTGISIHADLSARRVELRDDGERVLTFPVTVGAPGTDTPPGRFAVTDVVFGGLDPVYGCCAIALSGHQPNLPAGWIGGDRIAIHGTRTGDGALTGAAASSGCLRAADADVRLLGSKIPLGAPVFIQE